MTLYILIALLVSLPIMIILDRKKKLNIKTILKVLSIMLFIIYIGRLFMDDAIDSTFKLTKILNGRKEVKIPGTDNTETVLSFAPGLMSGVSVAFLMILRWFTVVIVAASIISPFVQSKSFKNIVAFIGTTVVALNIIFFIPNLIGYVGKNYNIYGYRSIQFAIETYVTGMITGLVLYTKISDRDFKDMKNQILRMFLIFVCILPAFFQQGMLQVYFGQLGQVPEAFNISHRVTVYFTILMMVTIYFSFRNRSLEDRRLFFVTVALAGFFQYFYDKTYLMGMSGLPLHLCNTAIIMMFFAFIFKLDGVFYFAYFVNVPGALVAILIPTAGKDLFALRNLVFWYNHIYAFALPVLGVALKVWKRPNMKQMLKAMFVFTIYFVLVGFINAWFNGIYMSRGQLPGVDYFFLYKDQLNEKFHFLAKIQYENVIQFEKGGILFKFFWKYQILIYVSFIGIMFITWYVYDAMYKIADSHHELVVKLKKQKMDMLSIKKEYKEMKKTENKNTDIINNDNLIQISHFSKAYGNAKKNTVDDFSIDVKKGEVFGFLGHNGAGKSTTIKSLVGIQSISEGSIKICGYDIEKNPLKAKLQMGYVSDNHAVYEKLTGREYVNYVADLYMVSLEDREERLEKYLRIFKLEDAIDRQIKSYSHGMKQKIVVIASLIHNPKVWVLDEPLTGLDPSSSYQIKECMRDHANAGNVVFFSSHVIEIVEKICDKIVIISNGRRKGILDLKKIRDANISLEEVYLKYVYKNADEEEITIERLLKDFKNE